MSTLASQILRSRRFLPLFITQFLGAFNDNIFKNSFIILIVFRMADAYQLNAQTIVAMASGLFILPFFMFSAMAGQFADKYEKSTLVSIVKVVEIVLMAVGAVGFYLNSLVLLMTVLFLLGIQATFFGPLKYAILPEQLDDDELILGNGLIEGATFIAILLGTIVGGVVILQANGQLIISVVLMLISILGLWSSFYILKSGQHQPHLKIQYNVMVETLVLFAYSYERRDIFLCIFGISWFWLFGAIFLSELPVFTESTLKANQAVVTFFLALFSIGLAIGSVLCNQILQGSLQTKTVGLGLLGSALFTFDLYLAMVHQPIVLHPDRLSGLGDFLSTIHGWRIVIDLFLTSICGGLYTIPLFAIMQNRSPRNHCARVIASNNITNAMFMVISSVGIIGMSQMGFSVPSVFLLLAVSTLVVAFYMLRQISKGFFVLNAE